MIAERGTPYDSTGPPAGSASSAPSADDDSDSDEDDSVPSLAVGSSLRPSDDDYPTWYTGAGVCVLTKSIMICRNLPVSPAASRTNGAQGIHHAADTAAAASFGLLAAAKGPADSRYDACTIVLLLLAIRTANAARVQLERKQKEKERKLEGQVEDLKHQLLYGLFQ